MRKGLIYYTHSDENIASDLAGPANYNGFNLAHVSIHNSLNRNAGDTLLPQAVRAVFDFQQGGFRWEKHQVWQEFTRDKIDHLNQQVDALIVGGGGFLIRDQQGGNTSNSGWLWNIPEDNLHALKSHIVLFAVGYNRFRGQQDFDSAFKKHINAVIAKSTFVGLRNNGSIRRLSEYLDSQELIDKLRLQFCPTTSCWQLYKDMSKLAIAFDRNLDREPVLAFNFAYDRPHLRFGDNEDRILKSLAKVMKKVEDSGWKIVLTAHKVIDRAIETYLDGARVNYVTHDLTEAPYQKIMEHYAQCDLAIGMRGHGQMIPFGLQRPIISLITHDKMAYFLEDIQHPEWGLELTSPNLEEELWESFNKLTAHQLKQTKKQVSLAQEKVWKLTQENINWISREIGFDQRKAGFQG